MNESTQVKSLTLYYSLSLSLSLSLFLSLFSSVSLSLFISIFLPLSLCLSLFSSLSLFLSFFFSLSLFLSLFSSFSLSLSLSLFLRCPTAAQVHRCHPCCHPAGVPVSTHPQAAGGRGQVPVLCPGKTACHPSVWCVYSSIPLSLNHTPFVSLFLFFQPFTCFISVSTFRSFLACLCLTRPPSTLYIELCV